MRAYSLEIWKSNINNLPSPAQCTNMLNIIEGFSMTLQFLWNFDHQSNKFYLSEQAHFSFETLKTKILFFYSRNNLPQLEAEIFVRNLYNVAKTLSMRPKFQLILISLYYIDLVMLDITIPLFREQTNLINYFTRNEIDLLNFNIEKNNTMMVLLEKLLVHFDLYKAFQILKDVIPRAVEMELFMLSKVSKQALLTNKCWIEIKYGKTFEDFKHTEEEELEQQHSDYFSENAVLPHVPSDVNELCEEVENKNRRMNSFN